MEVYRTKDSSKYIHDDGSETIIKTSDINTSMFSVSISSSAGCSLGCKYCYLTIKNYPYCELTTNEIFENVKIAICTEIKLKPDLRKRYMRLEWNGMGDAFLLDPIELRDVSNRIISWSVREIGAAIGVDSIYITTILPESKPGWPHQLALLNDDCFTYRFNPKKNKGSNLQLFYSLNRFNNRNLLMPAIKNNTPISDLHLLNQFKQWYGVDITLNQLLIEGENDTIEELRKLKSAIDNIINNVEVNILRLDYYDNSKYKESSKFNDLVKLYTKELPKVTCQQPSN